MNYYDNLAQDILLRDLQEALDLALPLNISGLDQLAKDINNLDDQPGEPVVDLRPSDENDRLRMVHDDTQLESPGCGVGVMGNNGDPQQHDNVGSENLSSSITFTPFEDAEIQ